MLHFIILSILNTNMIQLFIIQKTSRLQFHRFPQMKVNTNQFTSNQVKFSGKTARYKILVAVLNLH